MVKLTEDVTLLKEQNPKQPLPQ